MRKRPSAPRCARTLRQQRNAKEETLKKTERVKALLQERDGLLGQIADLDKRMTERADRLREMTIEAWTWLLRPYVQNIREKLQAETDELRQQETKLEMSKKLLEDTEQALAKRECHSCHQPLPIEHEQRLRDALAGLRAAASAQGQRDKLDAMLGRMLFLRIRFYRQNRCRSRDRTCHRRLAN